MSSQPPPSDGGSDTTEDPEILILSEELPRRALQDEDYQAIKTALANSDRKMKGIPLAELEIKDDLIVFRRHRYLVPDFDNFRTIVIQQHYKTPVARHPGRARTYELIQRHY